MCNPSVVDMHCTAPTCTDVSCPGPTENSVVKKDIKTATRMLHAARVELQDANDRLVEVMVGASVAPAEVVRLMTRFVGEAKLQASGCAGARGPFCSFWGRTRPFSQGHCP